MVAVVGVPVALAAYTGSYAPSQAVSPRAAVDARLVRLHGSGRRLRAAVLDGYGRHDGEPEHPGHLRDRRLPGRSQGRERGTGTPWATPSRTATSVTDDSFGGLSLGTQISYRMRSAKSTNWVSPDTATVTATVTSLLIFVHVQLPVAVEAVPGTKVHQS